MTIDLTEDEALTLFHQLRSQFDWSGTIFMRGDVESMVIEQLGLTEGPELTEAEQADVTQYTDRVMNEYGYRKLGDILSERGNEVLDDTVNSVIQGRTTGG